MKIPIQKIRWNEKLDGVQGWAIPCRDKQDVPRFFRDLQIGKITGNQITEQTLVSYLAYLRIGLEFFNKTTTDLTPKHVERLCEALVRNQICRKAVGSARNGNNPMFSQPFSDTGKIKIRNVLIMYLKWKLGRRADRLVSILAVRPRLKQRTPDFLSEPQVEKLYKACWTNEQRFLVAVLFDSGARAEEFHNIRREDIEIPTGNQNFVRLTLKEEYSKTKGRVISLYWKHSLEAVRDYLQERIGQGLMPGDPVFAASYSSARQFLYRLGENVLGRHIHFHLFRHSSATYYASRLNRQQLCIRYGWRFSSPMPDVYISRVGMDSQDLDQKFAGTEVEDLKAKFEKQAQELAIVRDWKSKAEETMATRNLLDSAMKELLKDPENLRLIATAMAKQGIHRRIRPA